MKQSALALYKYNTVQYQVLVLVQLVVLYQYKVLVLNTGALKYMYCWFYYSVLYYSTMHYSTPVCIIKDVPSGLRRYDRV